MSLTQSPATGARPLPQSDPWAVAVKLGRLADRRIQEKPSPLGVSAGQYIALSDIARHPGISRAALARRLQVSPQGVAAPLENLAGKGLLVRTEAGRGRPIALDLTEAGYSCVALADRKIHGLSRELIARCFGPEAITAVERTFQQVLGRLRLPAR